MKKIKLYFKNIIIAIDQLANSLLGGNPDRCISSRLWENYRDSRMRKIVDWLFKWQRDNHCEHSSQFDDKEEAVLASINNKIMELNEQHEVVNKVTPIEAVKGLFNMKTLTVLMFGAVFGIMVFLGIMFYKGLSDISKLNNALAAHENALKQIVDYINQNVPNKK